MLGAIVGDIVGSVYEWNNIKTKDFPLFRDDCFFTDDTVMTVAVADAIMQGEAVTVGDGLDSYPSVRVAPKIFIDTLKKWGKLYPNSGYGIRFRRWLLSHDRKPYNSWGNGSAMRVSPCAWVVPVQQFQRLGFDGVLDLSEASAAVTHDHEEGVKGAQATAAAIFYARYGRADGDIDMCKNHIRRDLGRKGDVMFGYDLNQTLDEIRPTYEFNETCQDTVPQAIIAFLESTGFEDAIRNAISLGGDSDTLAAITGSIAEAAYGIPREIADIALSYLDAPLLDVFERWRSFCTWYTPFAD